MLQLYTLTILLVRRLAPYVRTIERHDPDLARQMRRALTSIPLNTADGMDARGNPAPNRTSESDSDSASDSESESDHTPRLSF